MPGNRCFSVRFVALLLVAFLAACQPVVPLIPTSSRVPPSTATLAPTLTLQPTSTIGPTSTPAPTATPVQTISHECPPLLPADAPTLLQTGSVLFSPTGQAAVWSVRPGLSQPQIVNKSAGGLARLSPDGTRLAWTDDEYEPPALAVYDWLTKQEARYRWQDDWRYVIGWDDDRVIRIVVSESRGGYGIGREETLLDVNTRQTGTRYISYFLPAYHFEENNFLGGYASPDPTGTLVLFTAFGDHGMDTVLEKQSGAGTGIWRHQGQAYGWLPPADWTDDGSQVAFVPINDSGDFPRIFSLDRDGQQLGELTYVPLDAHPNYVVRELQWSSDKRYLEYALLGGPINQGPGFILDTQTLAIREFCHGKDAYHYGQWLPNSDLFLYWVDMGDNMLELRVLDVSAWQTQRLADASAYYINIIGWTPLALP
jgi:hypothetical protein